MKIVLANAVGKDKEGYYIVHSPSRWSLGVKNYTNCTYYPWELAYTSSLLKRETEYDIKLLDGVQKKWDFKAYFREISREKPDFFVMESSSRTIEEDKRLAGAVKNMLGAKIIFTGQHPTAFPQDVIDIADYICIGEYEYTVLDIIKGVERGKVLGLYSNKRRPLLNIDSLPFPEDDDISRIDYHEPNCEFKEIQMYASRGCPFSCSFCVARYLYYGRPKWRPRNIQNIISEIIYLKTKYPQMEGIFFDEEVHNVTKRFILDLTKAIIKNNLSNLKYDAMCIYTTLDEKILDSMKEAGYYKIRIGIETNSDVIAKENQLGKKHGPRKLLSILNYARNIGLKTYGTFTIGALGSSKGEDKKTVNLIKKLSREGLLTDIQVSINTPQPGTPFYRIAKEKGYIKAKKWNEFDGGNAPVVGYPDYSSEEIEETFKEALSAYDSGTHEYRREKFREIAGYQLSKIDKPNKILVLRSARMWHMNLVLEILFDYYKKSVDILAQDNVVPLLSPDRRINKLFSYGEGFFNPNNISKDLYKRLNNENYDTIVLAYNSTNRDSYKNIFDTIKNLNVNTIIGFFQDGRIREEKI